MDYALRSNAVVINIFPGCTSDILRGPERRGLGVAAETVDNSLECSTIEWYVVSCILFYFYSAESLSLYDLDSIFPCISVSVVLYPVCWDARVGEYF